MPQTVPPLTTALHHGPLRRPVPKRPRPSIPAHAVSLFLENGGHTRASCLPCCSLSPEPSFLLGHKLSTLHVSAREPPRQSRFLQTGPRAQGALSLLSPHLCSHHGARARVPELDSLRPKPHALSGSSDELFRLFAPRLYPLCKMGMLLLQTSKGCDS